jgi:hypothetical protein
MKNPIPIAGATGVVGGFLTTEILEPDQESETLLLVREESKPGCSRSDPMTEIPF